VHVSAVLVGTTELRQRFSARLSTLYGHEVPAYTTLLDVANAVNADVLRREGADAERLGSLERITAERHGAIRVGTERELGEVAQVFAAFGMVPVGFYDLRDAAPSPIPVVSTAFRPVDPAELAVNPFRVFTSMLVSRDRRFFGRDLAERLDTFLERRQLFGPDLLALARRAEDDGGLPDAEARRLVDLAAEAFALADDPIDRAWYAELETVSSVAADIGGVASTHINHLTPRVLDIEELYRRMVGEGIAMIDEIQGPPGWDGPDLLLRQTSFRALAEPRRFHDAAGNIERGELSVRFGEVEKRGIAPTAAGHALYEQLLGEADALVATGTCATRDEAKTRLWSERVPATEQGLIDADLGYFSYEATGAGIGTARELALPELVRHGWASATPIVYEDFLPRSAAGIFASNLVGTGRVADVDGGAPRDRAWMSAAIGRDVVDPHHLYGEQQRASLDRLATTLGLDPRTLARVEPAP
jgi:uncharacterized glyoxalase superfamily metalloenzyme YdcJ